jgi:hypothetical protein
MKFGTHLVLAAVVTILSLALLACSDNDEPDACPGITCNNCSGSGNCNLSCPAGQAQYCIAHPDNSNLRCSYCR